MIRRFLFRLFILLLLLLAVAVPVLHYIVAPSLGARMNATLRESPYVIRAEAAALHQKLRVADLHADSLLWNRDLTQRGAWGHVDLPRLREGNIALQAFTIVTKAPRGQNIDRNTGETDQITLLAMAQLWPPNTWFDLTQRALWQARRLQDLADQSNGRLTVIRAQKDLREFLERRQKTPDLIAGFLGIEGAHALGANENNALANLDQLDAAGIRMIGLAHFFDNEYAGSAHGAEKYGLTESGRRLVTRMQEKKIFVDLSHCSGQVIDDVLAMAVRPVIVSHSGVKGTCNNNRNLTDDQLKRIAVTGGIVGVGYWETASCGKDARAIARAIRHGVTIMGIDHVALGSDYDGAVTEPFDTTGAGLITEALLEEHFSESDIRKIMGENVIRVLLNYLP